MKEIGCKRDRKKKYNDNKQSFEADVEQMNELINERSAQQEFASRTVALDNGSRKKVWMNFEETLRGKKSTAKFLLNMRTALINNNNWWHKLSVYRNLCDNVHHMVAMLLGLAAISSILIWSWLEFVWKIILQSSPGLNNFVGGHSKHTPITCTQKHVHKIII